MNLLSFLISLSLAFSVWSMVSLAINYVVACKTRLPIVLSPVYPLNPLWILAWRTFPFILQLKHLPFGLGHWVRCTYMGWTFSDKRILHDELGSVFIIITPSGNEVIVAHPASAHDVLSRRKDFIKPAMLYEQLNVFGPNVNTVEGKDWERHRKLTAPQFNEKTSAAVWSEACRQTHDLVQSWLAQGPKGTRETVADTATLALHVLTFVGFGLQNSFHRGVREVTPGHKLTYLDALLTCLRNIVTFAILPRKILSSSFLPQSLQKVGCAATEFQRYMEELLSRERNKEGQPAKKTDMNLLGALAFAADRSQESDCSDQKKTEISSSHGLSDSEIFGNLFAFNLAGYETTANVTAASLVLLAAYPEYQDWIHEEIVEISRSSHKGDDGQVAYEDAFPRSKRCMAIMYETLRLYGSVPYIPRSTGFHEQTLEVDGSIHILPSGTSVSINTQALHTDPAAWGEDAFTWRPKRWIERLTKESQPQDKQVQERLLQPPVGTFMPWADGPRVCIGRSFSQVEFVAVLTCLFEAHYVRPAGFEEKEMAGKEALMSMLDGSKIMAITLQMTEPKKVALLWEERS